MAEFLPYLQSMVFSRIGTLTFVKKNPFISEEIHICGLHFIQEDEE